MRAWRGKPAVLSIVLVGMTSSMHADSAEPRFDIPSLGNYGNTRDQSVLTAGCSLLSSGPPRRIRCSFSRAGISPPDPQQIAFEVSRLDSESNESLSGALQSICRERPWLNPPADAPVASRVYGDQLEAACRTQSPDKLRTALKWHAKEIDAKTCRLRADSFDAEFEQVNADAWSSVSTNRGLCNIALIMTLWRRPGDGPLWKYRQVRVSPLPGNGTICDTSTLSGTSEHDWRARRTRELGCQYFEF